MPNQILTQLPSLTEIYSKAILKQWTGKKANVVLPDLYYELKDYTLNPSHIEAFRQLCGFTDSPNIPVTYLHNIAFRLHMKIMTHPLWPMAVMGTVHVRNQILSHNPISVDFPVTICCSISSQWESKKGLEFELSTQAYQQGHLVWEDFSTFLRRSNLDGQQSRKAQKYQYSMPDFDVTETVALSASLGRRFSRISGDANPIHLSNAGARLFGFKQCLVHGMWSKSRCVAELIQHLDPSNKSISVAFKQPLFIPGTAIVGYSKYGDRAHFSLYSNEREKVYLIGEMKPIST